MVKSHKEVDEKALRGYLKKEKPLGIKAGGLTCLSVNGDANGRAENQSVWIVRGDAGPDFILRKSHPTDGSGRTVFEQFSVRTKIQETLALRELAPPLRYIDFLNLVTFEELLRGRKPHPNEDDARMIARAFGKLHETRLPSEFRLPRSTYAGRFKTLERRLEDALREPAVRNVEPIGDFAGMMAGRRIRKFFSTAARCIDYALFSERRRNGTGSRLRPVLLHGDAYAGNILIVRRRGGEHQARFIDLRPKVGDPTFDFGNVFVNIAWRVKLNELAPIFLKEYQAHSPYPDVRKLFLHRMVERDVTSLVSECRDAAALIREKRSGNRRRDERGIAEKYFALKQPLLRLRLISEGLSALNY